MDNKKFFIYKLVVKLVATLLFCLKILYLYIAYLIFTSIFKMTGFLSLLLIVLVWTSFNTLTDFVLHSIIEKNSQEEIKEGDING